MKVVFYSRSPTFQDMHMFGGVSLHGQASDDRD